MTTSRETPKPNLVFCYSQFCRVAANIAHCPCTIQHWRRKVVPWTESILQHKSSHAVRIQPARLFATFLFDRQVDVTAPWDHNDRGMYARTRCRIHVNLRDISLP